MTLDQWRKDFIYAPFYGKNGNVAIPDFGMSNKHRTQLWELSDYRVAYVSGGSIWLSKVEQNQTIPLPREWSNY